MTVAILDFEMRGLLSSGGDRATACDHPSVMCIPIILTAQSRSMWVRSTKLRDELSRFVMDVSHNNFSELWARPQLFILNLCPVWSEFWTRFAASRLKIGSTRLGFVAEVRE